MKKIKKNMVQGILLPILITFFLILTISSFFCSPSGRIFPWLVSTSANALFSLLGIIFLHNFMKEKDKKEYTGIRKNNNHNLRIVLYKFLLSIANNDEYFNLIDDPICLKDAKLGRSPEELDAYFLNFNVCDWELMLLHLKMFDEELHKFMKHKIPGDSFSIALFESLQILQKYLDMQLTQCECITEVLKRNSKTISYKSFSSRFKEILERCCGLYEETLVSGSN